MPPTPHGRAPRILDVIRAVIEVAPAYPDVIAWWYAPPKRLDVAGNIPDGPSRAGDLEIVVQRAPAGPPDRVSIARDLSVALPFSNVSVRAYRGPNEERALFRLFSR